MSKVDEVIYGVTGQTVELYPPEWPEGIPSSASASIYEGADSSDDTAEFSPSVTVDSVSTTFDQNSGFSQTDKRTAYITSTSSIAVARFYLTEDSKTRRELVKVTGISSGDHVTLQEPLKYDYVSTNTFKGIRLVFTVDSTWVATEDNILAAESLPYRVVWSYTVNSLARRHYTYLRLVRQTFKSLITIYDIAKYLPDVALAEPESGMGQQARFAISAAHERVRVDLIAASIQPESIRDTEIVKELERAKAISIIALWHTPSGLDRDMWIATSTQDYKDLFVRVTAGGLKAPVDKSTEGGITNKKSHTLWFGR